MKKTISINIKGFNFVIEEDAFELLNSYLKSLEENLKNQDGYKEIIEDIELRIAELCQGFLNEKKQVVEIEDIKTIINTLGKPEDFNEESNDFAQSNHTSEKQIYVERRLYRDVENAKIAGICSGLSNYFNIDVIVIRILFLAFLFFGGFGFPLYIILWIVIPNANTTIDRLKMQGKPITVDSVKEEIELAAERVSSSSKSFVNKIKTDKNYSKRFSNLGQVLLKAVGVLLIGFGLMFLISFLFFVLVGINFIPIETIDGFIGFNELGNLLLKSENDTFLAWLGVFLASLSVILFFLSNGTYLLMNIKNKWTKSTSFTLFVLGIIGFSICIYIGSIITKDMFVEAKIEKEVYSFKGEELFLNSLQEKVDNEYKIEISGENREIRVTKNEIQNFGIEIIYRTSNDSLFHVYHNFKANSFNYETAIKKAKNIRHSISIDSNNLKIKPYFSYPKEDKLRNQQAKIIVEIPNNKSLIVNGNKINLLEERNIKITKYGYVQADGEIEIWD